MFKIAYVDCFSPSKESEWFAICKNFVDTVKENQPSMLMKQKIHLILHLVDCVKEFGPTSGFNSERLAMHTMCIIIFITVHFMIVQV